MKSVKHKQPIHIPSPDERTSISEPLKEDFSVEGPELLDLPDKMLPILYPDNFNKFSYFLIDGGRVSSKTQSVGRFLLYLGEQKKIRIVCGRIFNLVNERK